MFSYLAFATVFLLTAAPACGANWPTHCDTILACTGPGGGILNVGLAAFQTACIEVAASVAIKIYDGVSSPGSDYILYLFPNMNFTDPMCQRVFKSPPDAIKDVYRIPAGATYNALVQCHNEHAPCSISFEASRPGSRPSTLCNLANATVAHWGGRTERTRTK